MISKWKWLALNFTRELWVRAALFCCLAVFCAFISPIVAPFIPLHLSKAIGAEAVDHILNILASSMLVVTTFSLTVMVSAYSAATSNVTPRATKLLMQDTTTQNVLSTFIGSFLFSLVGIVSLRAGAYGEAGRLVLFVVTVLVIVLIILTMLRWIDHLSRLGQVGETTARVEEAAMLAFAQRMENPYLGGRPLVDPEKGVPGSAIPVYPIVTGYVQHLDMNRLSRCAEENDGEIYVTVLPGKSTHPARPLAWVDGVDADGIEDTVRGAFTIGDERSFDQDPRFGLAVLAEIASRALSPSVNDPGTAIDVIGRSVRILSHWKGPRDTSNGSEVDCPRVWVPPITAGDYFDDIFQQIARDGCGILEIQIRLQKAFLALCELGDEEIMTAAQRHAQLALKRAEIALALEEDKAAVRQLAASVADMEVRETGSQDG